MWERYTGFREKRLRIEGLIYESKVGLLMKEGER